MVSYTHITVTAPIHFIDPTEAQYALPRIDDLIKRYQLVKNTTGSFVLSVDYTSKHHDAISDVLKSLKILLNYEAIFDLANPGAANGQNICIGRIDEKKRSQDIVIKPKAKGKYAITLQNHDDDEAIVPFAMTISDPENYREEYCFGDYGLRRNQ
jgi:hypothetical protein